MMPIIVFGILFLMRAWSTTASKPTRHLLPSCNNTSCTTSVRVPPLCLTAFRPASCKCIRTTQLCQHGKLTRSKESVLEENDMFNVSSRSHRKVGSKSGASPRAEFNHVYKTRASCETDTSCTALLTHIVRQNSLNVSKSNLTRTAVKCPIVKSNKNNLSEHASSTRTITQKTKGKKQKSNSKSKKMFPEYMLSTGSKVRAAKTKNLHRNKRLYRREASKKKYWRTLVSTDKSSLLSDLFTIIDGDKNYDNVPDDLLSYLGVRAPEGKLASQAAIKMPLENKNDFTSINRNRKSTKHLQLIDHDFDQALDLLDQYITIEKANGGDRVNLTLLREKLPQLNTGHQENMKVFLQNDHLAAIGGKLKRGQDEENNDNDVNLCRESSVWEGLLRSFTDPDFDDFGSMSCSTDQDIMEPRMKIVSKKSTGSLVGDAGSQSLTVAASESCSHRIETKLITLPGCVPKSILITRCYGSCSSRSAPEWNLDSQGIRQIKHCTCCSSFVMKFRTLNFHCPRRPERVLTLTLGFPFRCACRPCASVPEVTAQQPYDY